MTKLRFLDNLLISRRDTELLLTYQGREMQRKLWSETLAEMTRVDPTTAGEFDQ